MARLPTLCYQPCVATTQTIRKMKPLRHIPRFSLTSSILLSFSLSGFSQNAVNEKCPITGRAANPKCTTKYEGETYAFCSGKCCKEFTEDRHNSIYHKIGGADAVNATIDLFYTKVLADKTVNHYFDGVDMKKQHKRQKAFVSAALGGPKAWTGKDMRKAHLSLELKESDFNAIAGHLQKTLQELKVKEELIKQVMAVAASTKDDVLNRKKKSAK